MREGLQGGTALVGTVDAWLVWNLTGGAKGSAAEVEDQRPAWPPLGPRPVSLCAGCMGPARPSALQGRVPS